MINLHKKNKQSGFNLIEATIYIALFGIIIGGVMVSVYNVFESSGRNQTKAMLQEEGTYILGKIDWALTGAKTVNVSVTKEQLYINRDGILPADNPLTFDASGGVVRMVRGAIPPSKLLNNTNVTVTNAVFTHTLESSDGITPESVEISFTLTTLTPNGFSYSQDFSTIKYLRK